MSRISTLSCVLTVLVLLAGCRTYGGNGSEEAIYNQIERILDRFEGELSRARGEVSMLEAASSERPDVTAFSAQYMQLVEAHEAILDQHREMAEGLSPRSSYRSLHRAYGAMIAEQALLRQQYQGMLRYVYDAYSADTTGWVERHRPYALIPPYYVRAANAGRELTVNNVLSRMQSGAEPQAGFRLQMPETPDADESEEGYGSSGEH